MTATIKDGNLHLVLPIAEAPSKSGKTVVIASTHGNQTIPGLVHKGKCVTIGVNAYVK